MPRLVTGSIIRDNHLISCSIKILLHQCSQAASQQFRTFVGWHYHRNQTLAFHHHNASCGFSSKNEPITNASSGDVQKHSTASRGVHTIGSPRVLNEVFTNTGTPVRSWKALMRS